MNPFESNLWQDYGVLSKLFFNQSLPGSPEAILRELGFVHLYATSGIHLYAFLSFMEALAARFSRRVTCKWTMRAMSFFVVACLWKLQAFRLGFARPILTFLIREFAKSRGVEWRIFYPLGITLLLDFIFHLESGRSHYYLAILGGMLAAEHFKREPGESSFGGASSHLAMAGGSWLATAGLDFFEYHQIAWFTPLYSLITIPLISGMLYPLTALSLLFFPAGLPALVKIWSLFLHSFLWFADQGFTFSVITTRALCGGVVISILFLGVLYFVPRLKYRILAISMLLFLCASTRILNPSLFRDQFIAQLDVHQGDSALLSFQNRMEMIDVGSLRTFSAAEWIQKFSAHGVTRVDGVLFSHLDEDHVGALKKIAMLIPVDCVQTNPELWQSEKGLKYVKSLQERAPSVKVLGDSCMRLPEIKWFRTQDSREDGNGLMAGTVTPFADEGAYFALGDGDQSQEQQYEQAFADDIRRYPDRIWKVGHHGSRFSSEPQFLKDLNPEQFWLSVGKHNPYHHPHFDTLARISQFSGSLRRTDQEGDLVKQVFYPENESVRLGSGGSRGGGRPGRFDFFKFLIN